MNRKVNTINRAAKLLSVNESGATADMIFRISGNTQLRKDVIEKEIKNWDPFATVTFTGEDLVTYNGGNWNAVQMQLKKLGYNVTPENIETPQESYQKKLSKYKKVNEENEDYELDDEGNPKLDADGNKIPKKKDTSESIRKIKQASRINEENETILDQMADCIDQMKSTLDDEESSAEDKVAALDNLVSTYTECKKKK